MLAHAQRLSLTLKNMIYLPALVGTVRDWLPFLRDYIGARHVERTYRLRNGLEIATHNSMDTATIGVVFIRKEYGEIKDGSIIVDIGAHIGIFSLYAATIAQRTTVYAYEPEPDNYANLQSNIRNNRLTDRIRAFQLSVSNQRGVQKLYLWEGDTGHSLYPAVDNRQYVETACTTLQDIFDANGISNCDLLKLDCEGAEFDIIYATPPAYFARIACIRLEYHDYVSQKLGESYTGTRLATFLEQKGFRVTRHTPAEDDRGMLWLERV